MIRDCEEAAVNAADEPGCAPSDLLNLMTAWRAQIGLQLKGDLQVEGGQHLTRDELQQGMKSIIDILLDQNQQLVCCLAELEREAVKRTVQMQKRLQSTANTTRETVHKMSEWGEEIQTIISKKHLAEEAALESKYMVADLQKENRQLRNYNDNLYSDVQSLLSIINVARTTGNWEMDCVTFCVISPEEVYGPICHLSAQNTDGMATMDGKPDTLQSPETEYPTKFSESLPALFTVLDESMAIQEPHAPKSVESFLRSSSCNVKPRNVRRRLIFDTAKKLSAPKPNSRYKHLGAPPVKKKSVATKSYAEVGAQTCAAPPIVGDMSTQVNLSSLWREHDQNKASSHIHPLSLYTDNQRKSSLADVESECAINFSESLPAMFTEWHESVAIQEAPKSVKSFLCSSTCKVKSRNVRRRLVFDTAKKLSAPKHNARYKHLGASPVKSKSAAAKSCAEVGTQTFAVPPTVEDMCTQVNLSSALRKLDQNKASSHIHPLLVHTDDQRKSSHTNMKSECPINLSESVPAMFTVWDESVAIQDAPKSVKSFLRSSTCKVKSRNVRRRLVFDSAKKLSVPKLNSHYKHLGASPVKRDSAAMKAYAEVSAQTYSGAATVAQHCADVGTQTFATPPTLKEIGTQVDLSSSLMKNEQNESSATMLLLTGDEKKSTAMMSTQTDVEWETCLPSGNETRDQELCSLKDRLALAIQEAQSKALLAMELQVHLDMSAKEVELRDQVVSNLEKKLSAARQETDHLKKQLTSVECELESVKRISQKEKAETELCKSELEKMAVTVKHLQDALVEYKKNGAAASPTVLPKVHDV
ncbi:uncharacterized protein LOC119378193 isoform X2 [Rhipicephalus sanguineus]|nr:uncharacterized protein LOC119378193 isoform X2 [Rhipicephalus sanguineus]XP_037503345.1 uncharacterized protein LOC119378193 isoform X2 [Rhipicephalus sanguineus]